VILVWFTLHGDYDSVESEPDEDHFVAENHQLIPTPASRSNGYAYNHRNSNAGPNTNPISFKNDSGTVHYQKNNLVNSTEEAGASGEVDSDPEEFNRFDYTAKNGSASSKMLRGRDRYAPSTVDNPNYQQGGGVINIGPLDSDVQLDGSGDRAGSPSHQNVLSSDEYRRNSMRKRKGLISACCEAARFACW